MRYSNIVFSLLLLIFSLVALTTSTHDISSRRSLPDNKIGCATDLSDDKTSDINSHSNPTRSVDSDCLRLSRATRNDHKKKEKHHEGDDVISTKPLLHSPLPRTDPDVLPSMVHQRGSVSHVLSSPPPPDKEDNQNVQQAIDDIRRSLGLAAQTIEDKLRSVSDKVKEKYHTATTEIGKAYANARSSASTTADNARDKVRSGASNVANTVSRPFQTLSNQMKTFSDRNPPVIVPENDPNHNPRVIRHADTHSESREHLKDPKGPHAPINVRASRQPTVPPAANMEPPPDRETRSTFDHPV